MKTERQSFAVRITDKYILIMLLVFPLFTGLSGYRSITLSKYLFFVCATCAWLLLIAAYGVFSVIRQKGEIVYPDAPSLAVIVFMTVCCLSAVFSPFRESVFFGAGRYDGLATLLLYGGIFLGCARYARPRIAHAAALGISCTLCCAVAVLQLLDTDVLKLFPSGMSYYDHGTFYTGEFLGTIGNTNLLSAYLCLCIPLFSALFISGEGKRPRLFAVPVFPAVFVLTASGVAGGAVALCVCALCAAPVLMTSRERLYRAAAVLTVICLAVGLALGFECSYENRTAAFGFDFAKALPAFLAAALSLAAYGILKRPDAPRSDGRGYLRTILILEGAAVAAGLAALYFIPWSGGTAYELSRVLHGEINDSFGSSRIAIWKNVLALVPERPLLGGGPDTLALRLDMRFSRYVQETGRTLSVYVDNAHNEYLGLLVNTGVLGLAAFLGCMALTAGRLLARRGEGIYAAFGLGLVCYWVQAFFGLGLCITAPLMWIFWGMVCNYNIEGKNSQDE